MPRIQAATVAEHHESQRRALLDAARALLAQDRGRPPTLGQVAARAGLARPSVYQYFPSREELFEAVLEESFPRWTERVGAAMAGESEPGRKVLAYARANLELVSAGEHTLARSLADEVSGARIAERSRILHEQLRIPLVEALAAVGVPDPVVTAQLIDAVVHAATRLLDSGVALDPTLARVDELLRPFLTLTAATSAPAR